MLYVKNILTSTASKISRIEFDAFVCNFCFISHIIIIAVQIYEELKLHDQKSMMSSLEETWPVSFVATEDPM